MKITEGDERGRTEWVSGVSRHFQELGRKIGSPERA
jgi:hypothetical protein